MVGGKVTEVLIQAPGVLVKVSDTYDRCWRALDLTERSRCIGTGDCLWWQGKRTLWTPCASLRQHQGRDFDIDLGPSYATRTPEGAASP